MKKMNNKLFAALILFGMSGAAFGYDFTFTNKTDEAVTVAVKEDNLLDLEPRQANIQPRQSHTFSFKRNACLGQVWLNMKPVEHKIIGKVCKNTSFTIMTFQNDIILVEDIMARASKDTQ